MLMLNQQNKNRKKVQKSQILLLGSLLIFLGGLAISYNFIKELRNEIFEDMKQLIAQAKPKIKEENVNNTVPVEEQGVENSNNNAKKNVNYEKYLGILEIPKIGLKKGFYNVDSRYNSIQYNVSVVNGSTMPDVNGGNLMLMAHSGDAYISYFRYLYKLQIGDMAYVTYNDKKYEYRIVNIYDVVKDGYVTIERNFDITTLTLITCTYNDNTKQTVYIAELVG